MPHRSVIFILLFVFLLLGFTWTSTQYPIPQGWPAPLYSFQVNAYDTAQVRLGKYLFYDPILSRDSTISCASCHSSYSAFAHTDHPASHGIEDRKGIRNAPALFNLAWNKSFMWDGAIHHLDFQAVAPITGKTEMDNNLENIVLKIKKQNRYVQAFKMVFPNEEINANLLLRCLSQFQLSLISAQSKYDLVQDGNEVMSTNEKNGQRLYTVHCASCHSAPLFTNQELMYSKFANNARIDSGRFSITHLAKDTFLFKVPSLRNLAFTFPYFHDGHQPQLRAAIREHGSTIQEKYLLTEDEISLVISFLKTLDDPTFVFNVEHQFPKTFFRQ